MVSSAIVPGALAFLGPGHLPAHSEFRYVRVTAVQGNKAKVTLVNLDDDDEELDEKVDVSILKRRQVRDVESDMWPGMFVGHPIAFVQPEGASMDEWSFGVVTGYRMTQSIPWLHVRCAEGAAKIKLEQPPNVIKVDWVNYVIQTGAGTNASATNAEELVALMDDVCAQCDKSRSGLPSKVAKSLSVAFDADATVPIIRPDTLAVLVAPRQHVLDCALAKKSKKGATMFALPPPSSTKPASTKRKASHTDGERPLTRQRVQETASAADAAVSFSSDATASDATASDAEHDDAADVQAVLLQNRSFAQSSLNSAGIDGATVDPNAMVALADTRIHALDDNRGRSSTTFRPTTLEQQVHNALGHPDHKGKDAQSILECAQQARATRFRAAPPILRGAFDIGFHIRGLSVTHFVREPRIASLTAGATAVNMTDFSRKNGLPAATSEPSYTVLLDALTNLRQFGRTFYNADTVDVLNAAIRFIEEFADGGEPDRETTKRLLLWINIKLGEFRGLVISEGLAVAVRISAEFSVQDPLLAVHVAAAE
ncbi:hypothetical protein PF005_g14110 [Phytophthora fragariae]|uniref:Uncharacterized protein n=1 Tax=Phytophthora fragariae TaxID=53985 RepID=A0A6A3XJC0_9STRA|nr:hypothetical protein PF003_g34423 [Phytophthora fragariae]KAE8934031.1 hypothetical protein PF009_g15983 [Phytophthora fragariae]KAE9104203.1 hypothetical protein PF006_g21969 [Phytophthora fragariae]KAE9200605.1 hypothetical protein PF002_g21779 [Phytophthora fragariae]KAE9203627.1 hypothetical protein PF005_g14110 [Phytophthora fragariae]